MKFLSFINFWLVTSKKIVFGGCFFMFFPFRVNEIANLIAITRLKRDLRVILYPFHLVSDFEPNSF